MFTCKTKLLRLSALSAAVAGTLALVPAAHADGVDVSGSVGVASMYLWRGLDLGAEDGGVPAVSGDLKVSAAGFYTGIWGSSGDASLGTEYDLYAGYGAEFGDFTVDLSVWNYMYPSSSPEEDNIYDDFGGSSEAALTLGFAGFSVSAYDNIAGGSGYEYYTLAYSYKAFTVLVGKHDNVNPEDELGNPKLDDDGHVIVNENVTHVDVKYAHNDNLTFVLSQQVDNEGDDDLKFVVGYSLPIGD